MLTPLQSLKAPPSQSTWFQKRLFPEAAPILCTHLTPAVAKLVATGEVRRTAGGELNVGNSVGGSEAASRPGPCSKEGETKGWESSGQGRKKQWLLKMRKKKFTSGPKVSFPEKCKPESKRNISTHKNSAQPHDGIRSLLFQCSLSSKLTAKARPFAD